MASLEDRGLLYALGNFLIPSANAEITGLQPVQGATVELIYIDDNGDQVGDVLATTTTSLTGDYRLTLPEGVDFAANLVVRITGTSGFSLDAQVVSQTVDINPISDYVLDKLIENGTSLGSLATNEVVTLVGEAEQFDLTAGADMTEMLASLDAQVGSFLDNNIEIVNAGGGDAATIAGNYGLGAFSLELHDGETEQWGTFVTGVNLASVTLSDSGNGAVTADVSTEFDALAYLNFGGGYSLDYHIDLSGTETVSGVVDGDGALSFEIPFGEEIDTTFNVGWRFPPNTVRLLPAGSTGIYVGAQLDASVRYGLTDTDGDGTMDAVDPNTKDGDEAYLNLMLVGKPVQGGSAALLSGDYGVVGMDVSIADTGTVVSEAFYSVNNFDGASAVTESVFDGTVLTRSGNSAPVESSDTTPANGTYAVDTNGVLGITDGSVTNTGFVLDGGNAFGLFFHDATDDGMGTIVGVDNAIAMGIKLPASQPDMTAHTYRMFTLVLGYDGTGTLVETVRNAQIAFNGDGTLNMSGDLYRGFERATDTAGIAPISDAFDLGASNQTVTVGANGSIDIATITAAPGALKLDGFVSADGNLLLLRGNFDGANGEEAVTLLIGVKTQ